MLCLLIHGRFVLIVDLVMLYAAARRAARGCMVSMSSTGCGGRHTNSVNLILSGVTSMMVKPFFSVGLSDPQDLLNANGTVGIRAPTDGDRVGSGPQVRYP